VGGPFGTGIAQKDPSAFTKQWHFGQAHSILTGLCRRVVMASLMQAASNPPSCSAAFLRFLGPLSGAGCLFSGCASMGPVADRLVQTAICARWPIQQAAAAGIAAVRLLARWWWWRPCSGKQDDCSGAASGACCAESLEELRLLWRAWPAAGLVRIGSVRGVLERARRQFGCGGACGAMSGNPATGLDLPRRATGSVARGPQTTAPRLSETPPFGVFRGVYAAATAGARPLGSSQLSLDHSCSRCLQPLGAEGRGRHPHRRRNSAWRLTPARGRQERRIGRRTGPACRAFLAVAREAPLHREPLQPQTAFRPNARSLSPHAQLGTLSMR